MAEILTPNGVSVEATLPAEASWQMSLKRAIRSGTQLCSALNITPTNACSQAEADFSVFAPWEYVRRMEIGNSTDPLLLQVLGRSIETARQPGSLIDPVGDAAAERIPGLLQKYDRRALMITTGACAVHCRYCFRRHYPYELAPIGQVGWQPALAMIAEDTTLDEIILSGGDPLTLTDGALSWLTKQIGMIAHIRRLRIHTRLPVVIPQRVCEPLLQWVRALPIPVFFVLHFNHAAEIDASVCHALQQLRQAGATLLNQSVLLRGINDSFDAQRDLCLSLVNQLVLPYYLHQLDPVQGAMHFGVDDALAKQIVVQLTHHLPGYAVPKLVREITGEKSKHRLG